VVLWDAARRERLAPAPLPVPEHAPAPGAPDVPEVDPE
jgi:hypothetical protein